MIYSRIICRPVSALLSSVSRFFCETGKPVPVPVPVVWAVHAWVRGVGVWRVWHGTRRRGSTVVSLVIGMGIRCVFCVTSCFGIFPHESRPIGSYLIISMVGHRYFCILDRLRRGSPVALPVPHTCAHTRRSRYVSYPPRTGAQRTLNYSWRHSVSSYSRSASSASRR